ncbi:dynein light chain Tctex-type 1, partial [Caerostris darwini]
MYHWLYVTFGTLPPFHSIWVINEVFEEVTDNSDIELLAEQWASTVDEKTIWNLSKLNKPFKYIVTCAVAQKNGAGLQMGMCCFWNNSTD